MSDPVQDPASVPAKPLPAQTWQKAVREIREESSQMESRLMAAITLLGSGVVAPQAQVTPAVAPAPVAPVPTRDLDAMLDELVSRLPGHSPDNREDLLKELCAKIDVAQATDVQGMYSAFLTRVGEDEAAAKAEEERWVKAHREEGDARRERAFFNLMREVCAKWGPPDTKVDFPKYERKLAPIGANGFAMVPVNAAAQKSHGKVRKMLRWMAGRKA